MGGGQGLAEENWNRKNFGNLLGIPSGEPTKSNGTWPRIVDCSHEKW